MKNLFLLFFLACALSSCAVTTPFAVGSADYDRSGKVGVARTTAILGFFYFDGGDVGIAAAAEDGGITKISAVDRRVKIGFLGLWVTYETIVYGE